MSSASHTSIRRGEPVTGDSATGEVRVPADTYAMDVRQGRADLVMSRSEAERLLSHLLHLLGGPPLPLRVVPRGLAGMPS